MNELEMEKPAEKESVKKEALFAAAANDRTRHIFRGSSGSMNMVGRISGHYYFGPGLDRPSWTHLTIIHRGSQQMKSNQTTKYFLPTNSSQLTRVRVQQAVDH